MEKSRQVESVDEQTEQLVAIAPGAPEKEMPGAAGWEAGAELVTILRQIETYFDRQVGEHNLEALNFSLRHLFSRVDALYRQALPALDRSLAGRQTEAGRETIQRQQIWLQLQSVNRTLDRMAPLCHLLSDVIECLLDTLDNEEFWLRPFAEEATRLLRQPQVQLPAEQQTATSHTEQSTEPATIPLERWERAVTALMDRLLLWQEQHHKLAPFGQQFSSSILSTNSLNALDSAFAVLLDSAGAIFGDILPNFRLVGPEDREEIGALLFDLMQQSDQMLAQFEVALAPLNSLIRHFATVNEGN
ncbi:MAG TPA: hypothetical protein VFV38_28960 [Ktedonobacteraceae bacterium]|nr:hypothetical protein [Ktedonobacteraceae bacterium]